MLSNARLLPICALLSASNLLGQNPGTGLYAHGTFDSKGFDTINLGNLNTHFEIPIVNKSGRGLPFAYSIVYDGLIWSQSTSGGTAQWVPDSTWGFHGQLYGGLTGSMTKNTNYVSCPRPPNYSGNVPGTSKDYGFVYHDAYGGAHAFNYSIQYGCVLTNGSDVVTGNGSSSDGSGYTFDGGTVHARSGLAINAPYATGGGGSIADANGNTITNNTNGTYTDTTGTTELTITGGGNAGSPLKLAYPVFEQANNATTASTTIYYKTYTVQTKFACSTGDYGPTSVDLVDHITLGDGAADTYSFSYEATSGGTSGAVTGRLASITLPSGGTITYSYYGGTNGIVCPDGTPPGMYRSTTDGTKVYQRGGVAGNANAYTTMVQDEKNSQTYYHFSIDSLGRYEATHQQVYQGTVGQSTPLEEVVTCFNNQTGSCDGQSITTPITGISSTTTLNGLSPAVTQNTFDSTGSYLAETQQYSGSTLLTTAVNTYAAPGSTTELTSTQVTDGSGKPVSYTSYGYDETTATATSGILQHSSPSSHPGNQTSVHVSIDGTSNNAVSNLLTTTTAYYDTGMPVATTAPGGFTTSYGYDSTQTFQTSTVFPTPSSGVGLSTAASYDTASAALKSLTGLNPGQTTTVNQYDALLRVTLATTPVNGQITSAYTPTQVSSKMQMSSSQSSDTETFLDTYGRVKRVAVASGSGWYVTDSCYDAAGMLQYVGTPYSSTSLSASLSCSAGDSYSYDALGRMLSASHADGSSSSWTYRNRAVQQTDSPGTSKIVQYDLLGRQAAVCEVSSSSLPNAGTPTTCGIDGSSGAATDIASTGYTALFAYDLANHKTTITQGAQTRIFQTDGSGRPVQLSEPESGLSSYAYAYNGTGLFVTRLRPKANQTNANVLTKTTTQYDNLGRVVSVTYVNNSDGSADALTPNRTFLYDKPLNGTTIPSTSASKGQLIGSTAPGAHSRSYGYDIMGRLNETIDCIADWCSSSTNHDIYRFYGYNYVGELTSEQYATVANNGSPTTVIYGYNLAGQLNSVSGGQNDAVGAPNIYTASALGPYGATTSQLGNNLYAPAQYDAVGRKNGGWLCSGSSQSGCTSGTMLYGFLQTTTGTQTTQVSDTLLGRTTTYGYDEFNRLKQATPKYGSEPAFTMSATYDRYGNRWTESTSNANGTSPNTSFNFNGNNQITSFSYDVVGNLISDVADTYTYDAENNLLSISGGTTATYVYDELNERVKATTNGVVDRYGLDLSGRHATTWLDGSTSLKLAQYYAGAKPLAFWSASDGHIHFQTTDWLGTIRTVANNSGSVGSTASTLPFGESVASTGTDASPIGFALLDQDGTASTGLSHAMFREYSSIQGRWTSPDAYGGSYDASNPQSLNRYTYVLNNPLSAIDPFGLDDSYDCDESFAGCEDGGGGGGGGGGPTCISNCNTTDPTGGNDSPPGSAPPSGPAPWDPIITIGYPGSGGSGTGGSGIGGALSSGRTTCTGSAMFTGVGGNQAKYTGHSGALYSAFPAQAGGSIAGGAFGTVAVQNGFLGLNTRQLRTYGTQIFITPGNQGLISQYGGPTGPLSVSDYGDGYIQATPGTAFDLYRFPTVPAGNQFGRRIMSTTISFPNSSGGSCPAGFTVVP